MTKSTLSPFDYFTGLDGKALNGGYVYVGEVGKNPAQYPVPIYYDVAMTVHATQPLRTVLGYVQANNQPTKIYVAGDYSLQVLDKTSRQVFYVADSSTFETNPFDTGFVCSFDTVTAMKAELKTNLVNGATYVVKGYYDAGDGGGGHFYWNSGSTVTTNNGTVIAANEGGAGRHIRLIDGDQYSVKWFGAKGDNSTDDRNAINDAIQAVNTNGGGVVYFPSGKYVIQSQIPLCNNLRITGDGAASVIKIGTSFPKLVDAPGGAQRQVFYCSGLAGSSGGTYTSFVATHDIEIDNITIDGGYTNTSIGGADLTKMVGSMIQIGTCGGLTLSSTPADVDYWGKWRFNNISVHDCYFYNIPGSALFIANCVNVNVSNNTFVNLNTGYYTSGGAVISTGSAAEIRGCDGVVVHGNFINSTQAGDQWHGFTLISNYDMAREYTVSSNVIKNVVNADGISCEMNVPLNQTGQITFVGNRIYNCGGQGIGCDIAGHAHIIGNFIEFTNMGLQLSSTLQATVTGNVIKNVEGGGIVGRSIPDNTAQAWTITGNHIEGVDYVSVNYNGSGIYITKGATTNKLLLVISGNTINQTYGYGIYAEDIGLGNISNNTILNWDTAAGASLIVGNVTAIQSSATISNNICGVDGATYRYGISITGGLGDVVYNVLKGTYSNYQYSMNTRPSKVSANGAVITDATGLRYDGKRDHLEYISATGTVPTHKSADGDIVWNVGWDAATAGVFAWGKAAGNNTTWTAKTW